MGSVIESTGDVADLRLQVRQWVQENRPEGWHERLDGADAEEFREFNVEVAALYREVGLLAPHWPKEFGGGGFSFEEQLAIQEEIVRGDMPKPKLFEISLQHAAATLIHHGTPEQQKHLQAILDGEIWAQAFSEPNAGSDLASLQTRALRDGDHYVVNGQKIWSSFAKEASWAIFLARTNVEAPKHKGISFFMLDLSLPGVEIRPIRQAAGSAEFCEIFLTDVQLPAEYRIGEENDGWRLAQTTLSTERATQIVELHAQLAIAAEQICAEAAATPIGGGRTAADHGAIREDLARHVAAVDVLGFMAKDMVAGVVTHGDVGPEGSVVKVFYSETLQSLTGLAARIRGMNGQTPATRVFNISYTTGNWMLDHIESWTWTIAAGTNEIQRNIIGERILGLPREPKTV